MQLRRINVIDVVISVVQITIAHDDYLPAQQTVINVTNTFMVCNNVLTLGATNIGSITHGQLIRMSKLYSHGLGK